MARGDGGGHGVDLAFGKAGIGFQFQGRDDPGLCPDQAGERHQGPGLPVRCAAGGFEGGQLFGGDEGVGRLVDPADIAAMVERIVEGYRGPLSGRHLLVSAGGTSEPIDPVRVMTNRSTGRQGYALAEVAARLGARVTLVSATERELALDVRRAVEVVAAPSAAEMAAAMFERFEDCDAAIMAAAVADFSFDAATQKLKKTDGLPVLTPRPTLDIVAELARRRRAQVVVAFAAETEDVEARAVDKRRRKDVDLVVANDVSKAGAGFAHATNEVFLVGRDDLVEHLSMRSKEAVAEAILTKVASLLSQGAS